MTDEKHAPSEGDVVTGRFGDLYTSEANARNPKTKIHGWRPKPTFGPDLVQAFPWTPRDGIHGQARNHETLHGGPLRNRAAGRRYDETHTHKHSLPPDTQRLDSAVKDFMGCTVGMTHRQMREAPTAPEGCSLGQWGQLTGRGSRPV